jgi:hypothetical protein
MVIQESIPNNRVYLNLGSADPSTVSGLSFISVRKNTQVEVTVPIVPVEQNDRWIVFDLDGGLFQIGEHTYQVKDVGNNVLENGLLFVKNGTNEIDEYHGSLEGEKGEYTN